MLKTVRITSADSPLYASFQEACAASFPDNERRSDAAQRAALRDPRYRLDAWLDSGRFIAFMGWWDFEAFRYIEHVAVAPQARSGGYGKSILTQWLGASTRPVLLEIEEVVDDLTRRRLGFYERLGFKQTPGAHRQPPYQGGGPAPVMQTLSWPEPVSEKERQDFVALLHSDVWSSLSG